MAKFRRGARDSYGQLTVQRFQTYLEWQLSRAPLLTHKEFTEYGNPLQKDWVTHSCSVSKETSDLTVTRGMLWSNKV